MTPTEWRYISVGLGWAATMYLVALAFLCAWVGQPLGVVWALVSAFVAWWGSMQTLRKVRHDVRKGP